MFFHGSVLSPFSCCKHEKENPQSSEIFVVARHVIVSREGSSFAIRIHKYVEDLEADRISVGVAT